MAKKNRKTPKNNSKGVGKNEEAVVLDDNVAEPILESQSYAISDFPQAAADILVSFQFAQARLKELNGEMAVCQTAQVAYLLALKEELNQTPSTLSATTSSP
jgi:hypothetical protein